MPSKRKSDSPARDSRQLRPRGNDSNAAQSIGQPPLPGNTLALSPQNRQCRYSSQAFALNNQINQSPFLGSTRTLRQRPNQPTPLGQLFPRGQPIDQPRFQGSTWSPVQQTNQSPHLSQPAPRGRPINQSDFQESASNPSQQLSHSPSLDNDPNSGPPATTVAAQTDTLAVPVAVPEDGLSRLRAIFRKHIRSLLAFIYKSISGLYSRDAIAYVH